MQPAPFTSIERLLQALGGSAAELLSAVEDRIVQKVAERLAHDATGATIRKRLYTVEEAAEYLARTKDAVEHMLASGKLRAVRSDRRVLIDKQDMDRLIEENKS